MYQVMDGLVSKVYESRERVFAFDFDSDSLHLATASAHQVTVYMALKSVMCGDLYDMKPEYILPTPSAVEKIAFLRSSGSVLYLVIGKLELSPRSHTSRPNLAP